MRLSVIEKIIKDTSTFISSVSDIDSHPIDEWCGNLLDYQNNFFNAYICLKHS